MKFFTEKVKGFTLVEMLVTLALTSVVITFAYTALTFIQQLFYDYRIQNKRIQDYTFLKNKIEYQFLKADIIREEVGNKFLFYSDSALRVLIIEKTKILLGDTEKCDTFYIETTRVERTCQEMRNPTWENKLIKSLFIETVFSDQKFSFLFYKDYDTALRFKLEGIDND